MNVQKVREIIGFYKKHFDAISNEEIYKWRAVKRFQDYWDINAENFAETLKNSLSLTGNLLDSGLYFPRRMLLQYTEREPEAIRSLFSALFNEEKDWIERIINFQTDIAAINKKYFPDKHHYQDHRAVLVYLALHYPDIYFLYKFKMFKKFVQEVDYPYRPVKGRIENLTVYSNLCELLREEIIKDSELLELHKSRLNESHYFDTSFNILTQDVIYATVWHFKKFGNLIEQKTAFSRLIRVNKQINPQRDKVVLKGSFINYIEREKSNKRIGDLGELLVLKFERERLIALGSKKQPEHIAKTKGDGLGYDILSFNESDKEIYIEVKTTTGGYDTPFFITQNELEKSIKEGERFYLYRLYNYDEETDTAMCQIKQGSLESICINPVLYRVVADVDS